MSLCEDLSHLVRLSPCKVFCIWFDCFRAKCCLFGLIVAVQGLACLVQMSQCKVLRVWFNCRCAISCVLGSISSEVLHLLRRAEPSGLFDCSHAKCCLFGSIVAVQRSFTLGWFAVQNRRVFDCSCALSCGAFPIR